MYETPTKHTQTKEEVFLSDLKSRTAALHHSLERTRVSAVLMSPSITQADYIKYLQAMHAVVAWYETQLFPAASSVISDLDKRIKLLSLEKDLETLSASAPAPVNFTMPENSGEALGYMYVIEGSTLGGAVIAKQLAGHSFITSETTNFLNVYNAVTGSHWRNFIRTLSTYAVDHGVEEEVIEGAKNAFRQIYNHFISLQ